jgi:large subunit ribosomal protein L21
MYAIIKTGGKQYKVSPKEQLKVEKLDVKEGKKVNFEEVLLIGGDKTTVGSPFVKGAKVEAKVVRHGKGDKVIIYKYKAKKDYRKKQGHRQPYTLVEITNISV